MDVGDDYYEAFATASFEGYVGYGFAGICFVAFLSVLLWPGSGPGGLAVFLLGLPLVGGLVWGAYRLTIQARTTYYVTSTELILAHKDGTRTVIPKTEIESVKKDKGVINILFVDRQPIQILLFDNWERFMALIRDQDNAEA